MTEGKEVIVMFWFMVGCCAACVAVVSFIYYSCLRTKSGYSALLVVIVSTAMMGGSFAYASVSEPAEWQPRTDTVIHAMTMFDDGMMIVYTEHSYGRGYLCQIEQCSELNDGDQVAFELGKSGVAFIADGSIVMRHPVIVP